MKPTRHRITFLNDEDLECLVLLSAGLSNKAIQNITSLTECQIQYRQQKAKNGEGYASGQTYRSEWRDGSGDLVQSFLRSSVKAQKQRFKKVLPPLFGAKEPEVSPVNKRK